MRRVGDRVRITAQLVGTDTAWHIWTDRFEGKLSDIFELQDRITERVAGAIEPNVKRGEIARAAAKPPNRLDAYDHYLQALEQYYTMRRPGADAVVDLLRGVICLDGNFALAKAILAFVPVFRNT